MPWCACLVLLLRRRHTRVLDLLDDGCSVIAAKVLCQERLQVPSDGSCECVQRQESAPNGLRGQDVLKSEAR